MTQKLRLDLPVLLPDVPPEVVAAVERLQAGGRSTMAARHGQRWLGVLGVADRPREGMRAALDRLRAGPGARVPRDADGRNRAVGEAIGGEVGVDEVKAELLPEPEDKVTAIRDLLRQYVQVAMIGDGVNDAPALAHATVGIATGGAGTAVALETADVALMVDDLGKLPFAVGLSRTARGGIRQNLYLSLGGIALLVVATTTGMFGIGPAGPRGEHAPRDRQRAPAPRLPRPPRSRPVLGRGLGAVMTIPRVAVSAALVLLSSCDTPAGPRVDFTVTHTDQLESSSSTPFDLPPEPAVVQGVTGAVEAHGLIAAPDACDDLGAQLEADDERLTLRVIVRGSRTHPGGCGERGEFALVQWQARIEPVERGSHRVRVLYDYHGLRSHDTGDTAGSRDPYPDRVVAEQTIIVK